MPTLVIANKCYSSWSLRPWLLLKQLSIAFGEVLIPLDQPDTKAEILTYSPAGKVPILIEGDVTVWESIAIMDHVGETCLDARRPWLLRLPGGLWARRKGRWAAYSVS